LKAKILIVDDSVVAAEILKNVLIQEGHSIVVSNDGNNLVTLIKEHSIDIVLLDIVMPGQDGFELIKILKNTDETRDIPVIFITTLDSAVEVKKALGLGAMDFIRKTAEPIEIIARVNSALKLKAKQDQLLRLTQEDTLTRLYNKQYFNITFEKLINEKSEYIKRVALIMIDCDYFKSVNDRFGHTFGDQVLSGVANAIAKSLKQKDIACRFGGEEFCVILPDATAFQAFAVAERIRKNVEKISFEHPDETFRITVSCGVSHTDKNDNKSGIQVVNESDTALYKAKRNGRNQTVIFSSDDDDII